MRRLEKIDPNDVRRISFEYNAIRILLTGDSEVVFRYRNRDEMMTCFNSWVDKIEVDKADWLPA